MATANLYRATNSSYTGPDCGFRWWTTSRAWARNYGSRIATRSDRGLRLLSLSLDGPDAMRDLGATGIDVTEIESAFAADADTGLVPEIHMILSHRRFGPALAVALRRAGYDGVRHPDHAHGHVGEAVALLTHPRR